MFKWWRERRRLFLHRRLLCLDNDIKKVYAKMEFVKQNVRNLARKRKVELTPTTLPFIARELAGLLAADMVSLIEDLSWLMEERRRVLQKLFGLEQSLPGSSLSRDESTNAETKQTLH